MVPLCVALLFVALFSVLFVGEKLGHRCEGEHCPICVSIQQAERVLDQIGGGVLGLVLLAFVPRLSDSPSPVYTFAFSPITLVGAKVRLNN